MNILYILFLGIYNFSILLASFFNKKASLWIKGRRGWRKKLKYNVYVHADWVWFHAASLGEFEQGRPVIEEYRERFPNDKILLTFFSPSGYEVRHDYEGADFICYLPLDYPWNARKFIDTVQPRKAFFIKYEFWKNYLARLKKNNTETYMFSATFRKDQLFFKNYGKWYLKLLHSFNHIFVQDHKSLELLKEHDVENVTQAGDTRFDRVYKIASQATENSVIRDFCNKSQVIVAGSTWAKDEELIINYYKSLKNNGHTKLIIAPHEVDRENIKRINELLKNEAYINYRDIKDGMNFDLFNIIVVDKIGLLSSLYRYGRFAYIGGGFGKGIHNILEAVTWKKPVVFGPNYKRFLEAVELQKKGVAFSISDQKEANHIFDILLSDDELLEHLSKISSEYIEEKRGATHQILESLNEI